MSFLENCFNCYGIVVIISSGSFIFSINKDNSIQLMYFCQDCHMSRLIFNKRWMQILKNSIPNKLYLFALCAKELQWNLHNGHYFLPQKSIQTRFNLSMTATLPQWQWPVKFVPNAQITSQCWPVELMTCQIHETYGTSNYLGHMFSYHCCCFHKDWLLTVTGQLDNQLSSVVHKRGILICFNACSKQCVPQSFCFLDIFPLNIKLHLIAVSMGRKAPKKIRCHMTPLPLHNNHFLLSPRWLLWRGSTVSVILCRGEVYLSQLFLGMLPSSLKIKSILCHLKMLMVERLLYASFLSYNFHLRE